MLEERAIVKRIVGRTAYVSSLQASACGHCVQRESCGTTLYTKWLPKREFPLAMDRELRVGDQIVMGIEESHLLRASLLMYMLPLLIMMATVAAFGEVDANAVLPAFVSLAGSFFLISRLQWHFIRYFIAPPKIIKTL